MNKQLIIGTAILPMAFICVTALARMPGPPSLERFDTNGDGRVTREEIEAVRATEFKAADSNGDDSLSFSELGAFEQQQRQDRLAEEFALLDQDGSGGISAQEFTDGHPQDRAAAAATVFGLADLDGDASLSLEELDALRQGGPGPWNFANMDQDGSGSVSQEEFTSAAPPHGPAGRGRR